MASTYLTRTPSSAGNRRTWTISTWVKKASDAVSIFSAWYADSTVGHFVFRFGYNGSQLGWSQWSIDSYSTRLFRDPSAWCHVVLAVDTTQGTASNRIKMYVNGVQETSFSVGAVYPSLDEELPVNNNNKQVIGANSYSSTAEYFNGSMSHFHFIDGTAYDASAFGSTDATTGEWKINTSPSVTYGTNGFFILKDGNSVTDQSGEGNDFTVGGGTLTKTEDNPSNVFATMNPLLKYGTNGNALSEGNNTLTGIAYHRPTAPTISVNSGKWYFEAKALSGTATKWWIGLCDTEYDQNRQGDVNSTTNYIWGYDSTSNAVNQRSQCIYGNDLRDGGSNIAEANIFLAGAIAINDIYAMAVDLDNQKVWYSKNGVWNNGAVAESTTWDSGYPDSTNIDAGRDYLIGVGGENSKWSINYGNGYFGTTAVSSAGTNASGNGIFEYDVPTGFTALSTKGLNL